MSKDSFSALEFQDLLRWLFDENLVYFPWTLYRHHIVVDSSLTNINKRIWYSFTWNPLDVRITETWVEDPPPPDPSAGRKPTWPSLQRFWDEYRAKLNNVAGLKQARVNAQAFERIAKNYHPDAHLDAHKEWQVRLSGGDMADKDAERVRLIAVCHALEARIKRARTLFQLEAIDVSSDSVWAADSE